MSFKKDVVIYKKGETIVYICQCHNKGKKTKLFAVRRDDKTGLCAILGLIKWSGKWWQYVFEPESNTQWSADCKQGIVNFENKINREERRRWQRKKKLRK